MNCILCKANLTKGRINHIVDLKEGIIIIKNVPANICEQCGEYYLDTKTALELETMVDEINKIKPEVFIVNYNKMVA
ncbi:MAG: type II toxin-antitoxin system MqsA family antitoxin [Senegalia sp. (in: firmicutes)]|uniref:type II toxin-antitoxin system MqsA family antitoxin n=1 Tax=Senegalia sp. (in: firmicutes) TaxID=1924098 RepID=UPI003F96E585